MSKIKAKVLIVDDDKDILIAARLMLRQEYTVVHTESDPNQIPALLKSTSYDVILLDMNYSRTATSGQEGFFWLNKILHIDPSAVIIMITAYGDIELAVQGMKEGASNFILKPWENRKLNATIMASLKIRESKIELSHIKERQQVLIEDQNKGDFQLIGNSDDMQRVLSRASKVAATDANVMILGENGTGKEMIARAIHAMSPRANKPFIKVDLGAISETLFESELFGYKKGAFTDAREDRSGRFEAATGGTIFLDEIGNLSISLQSKLLSVLQNRCVTRLGSNQEVEIDVRVLCATNMPLYQMVKENKFRQDLLYRINTVEIIIPPLRDRTSDIPPLADYYLDLYKKKYNMFNKRFHASTLKRLMMHNWPGNIRELRHTIERAIILSDSDILQPQDFFSINQQEEKKDALNLNEMKLEDAEKILIRKTLDKHGGNISRAARDLGLTRASLYRRIEKYDL